MAESVSIREYNGGTLGTPTALTSITGRYCTIDSATPGTTNPCKVPTSGFYYSYWKSMNMHVTGTFNSIRDIYWYCDGNVASDWGLDSPNGGGLFIGILDTPTNGNGCPLASYAQAMGTPGVTGYAIGDVSNGHPLYRSQATPTANADGYTASAPLLIDNAVYTSAFDSKFWVTQLTIPPTAAHGELSAKSFSLSYQVY